MWKCMNYILCVKICENIFVCIIVKICEKTLSEKMKFFEDVWIAVFIYNYNIYIITITIILVITLCENLWKCIMHKWKPYTISCKDYALYYVFSHWQTGIEALIWWWTFDIKMPQLSLLHRIQITNTHSLSGLNNASSFVLCFWLISCSQIQFHVLPFLSSLWLSVVSNHILPISI